MSQRVYHRLAAYFLFPVLLVTAITGVSYRWLRNAFGIEKENVSWLLQIHQGSILPGFTVPYTGISGLGLLFLIVTGYSMVNSKKFVDDVKMKPFWTRNFQWKINTYRSLHQTLSSIVFVLLGVTALTGFAYRWARNVIGLPKETVGFLLGIHQGSFTGSPLLYTLITSSCLLIMLLSGITMLPWVRSLTSVRAVETTQSN